MHRSTQARLVFMANAELRLMVIRPIGYLSGSDLVDQLFERLGEVDRPWLYNRAIDLRRFDTELDAADIEALSRRWRQLRGRNRSYAHVAMIRLDACRKIHQATPLYGFPDETICRFTSYAEAYGWLTASDRHGWLTHLSQAPAATENWRRREAMPVSHDFIDEAPARYSGGAA